jgi:hypothetical protein
MLFLLDSSYQPSHNNSMKNKIEEWYRETNRHEKVDFLRETTGPWFDAHFIQELVTWMGEDDFNKFFKNNLVRYWELKTAPELYDSMIEEEA